MNIKKYASFTKAYKDGIDNWMLNWLQSWAGLLDGVVGVLTIGLVSTGFEMNVCAYRTKYCLRKNRKNNT